MPASPTDNSDVGDLGGRRRWIPVLTAALSTVALLMGGCAPAPAPTEGADRPALWVVRDPDTTVYLFGTVHQLPRGTVWDGQAVGRAIDDADELVLELSPDEMAAAPAAFGRYASDRAEGPVVERVPPELRADATIAIDDADVPQHRLDRLESWAAALLLAQGTAKASGLDFDAGVEQTLMTRFRSARRPIEGLETADQQIRLFDTLPVAVQRAMLAKVIRDRDAAPEKLEALLSAWRAGNVERLAAVVQDDTMSIEGLSKPLLTDRNAAWAAWIARRMDRPGTVLVAVGAAHLVGEGSVQDALAIKGVAVTRVQ